MELQHIKTIDVKPQGWGGPTVVLTTSGLVGFGAFTFSNYLQTRGFVDVELARMFLVASWVCGVMLVCGLAWFVRVRPRWLWLILGPTLVTGVLGGLEWRATRMDAARSHQPPPKTQEPVGAKEIAKETVSEMSKLLRVPTISFENETKILFHHNLHTRAPHVSCFDKDG